MLDRTESLNDGWIKTQELKDQPGVHLTGKYKRAFVSGQTNFKIFCGFALVGTLYFLATQNEPFMLNVFMGIMAGGLAFLVAGMFIIRPILFLLGKEVDVRILPEHIQIKKWRGYRTFSRNVPIEFRVEQHHKAAWEEMREQKRGKAGNRWYREAIEVVMQYGEKRISIAEMRMVDLEKAKALVIRLQCWCESFDQAVKGLADGKIKTAGENVGTVSGGDFGPAPDIR